ncbi:hypothetical protein [Actinokineospora inagensis]|uniref:hypothetical protein n=1 Tax=Actinokineospora inagensis TaxID=103730 RepID=UPI00041D93AD|nr:hypothetical protein [Actinokineospora inagensis]
MTSRITLGTTTTPVSRDRIVVVDFAGDPLFRFTALHTRRLPLTPPHGLSPGE